MVFHRHGVVRRARHRDGALTAPARPGLTSLYPRSRAHARLLSDLTSDRNLPGAAPARPLAREGGPFASGRRCEVCPAGHTMMAEVLLLVAIGAVLVVGVWAVTRRQRLKLREQAWLPEELETATVEFAERVFYTKWPFRLFAKIDRAYKTPDGALVLTELKRRFNRQAYRSDVVELSAQKLAIERGARRTVAATGFVVVEHPATGERTPIPVTLLREDEIAALRQRYLLLLDGTVAPEKANDARLCRSCAYVDRCKPDVLRYDRASPTNGKPATVEHMEPSARKNQLSAAAGTGGRPARRRAIARNPGRPKTMARSSPGSGQSHKP